MTPVTSFINKAKMAVSVTTVWMFVYFGLVWLKLRRNRRSRRMRALYEASRRRMAALHAEEEEVREILCVLLTRRIFLSTLQRRSSWIMPKSTDFSANTILLWDDKRWKSNFRVNKATFQYFCNELRGRLQRTNVVREAISVEKRIAITLWRLGTNQDYRSVAHLFGVGTSSVCVIVHEVCKAIVDCLLDKYISIPRGERAMEVIRGFEEVWGFPQCFGAIDGSHIPILAPHGSATEYYNRKGQHSIVLQALVDHNYLFMNTYVGWPGSVHDARVLSNSEVFAKGESGTLAPSSVKQICGVHVPVVILGDPAYPLLTWLMKPYTGTGLSQEQRRFNYRLSRARIVVECAFGRLKGRWRSLLKRSDVRVDFMSTVVTSCCILHNVCEVHKDGFDEEWLDEVVISESINATGANPAQHSSTAVAIRNALCTYFRTH